MADWNFSTAHVQQDLKSGQFASAETTLVAAGPPRLSQAKNPLDTRGTVYPIGLLENIGLGQSKQIQRIFEIGSSRSYFVPGRVIGSVNLGRVFYYGPSLLRALYAYYKNDNDGIYIGMGDPVMIGEGTPDVRRNPYESLITLEELQAISTHDVKMSPGEDYFFINLASDMFNQGTGIAVYFKDSNNNLIGAIYLEDCYVQGHNMGVSSGAVIIMEGVSMQFDRLVPIRVTN